MNERWYATWDIVINNMYVLYGSLKMKKRVASKNVSPLNMC